MSGKTTEGKRKDPYRHTLLLPQTNFAMKANLLELEPRFQTYWERIKLYQKMLDAPHPRGRFLLHDGPPYANGPIHMGHLLNKALKDLVVRSKIMSGHEVRFVPGWDCHGLPIEHKVLKELGVHAGSLEAIGVRKRCEAYADKYVKLQTRQLKRLGTIGEYDRPYLTMDPEYEAGVLNVFKVLLENGLVYRDLKPVHWSIENRTALADAELEYYERTSKSIYVLFDIEEYYRLPHSLHTPMDKRVSLMIWTTTPWTIPANLASVVAADGIYGLYKVVMEGEERCVILAQNLASQVFKKAGIHHFEELGSCSGAELAEAGVNYRHPFSGRVFQVFTAEYVSFDEGTGVVHTAPGHGEEDYETARRYGLPIYCPVREDGTFDDTAPEWLRGVSVWKANPIIVRRLKESGNLFYEEDYTHSYPHDWRSKTPTIFRATLQWFIAVDRPISPGGKSLRELALKAVDEQIRFIPDWGKNRLRGMLEARPDWCISRQRAWGLPIPAFHGEEGVLLTPLSVGVVAEKIKTHGSNYWFEASVAELLDGYDPAQDEDAPGWLKGYSKEDLALLKKGMDIFDVWFESGSSWNSVLEKRGLGYPADMYLEGSDQHRGWFQLSLLPALGATGIPPFRALLTHGFMVDAEGKKMSKSGGNAIEVDDLINKFGADVCRWWVSSLNYTHDIKVDWEFFKVSSEEYRKVRNTIRFLLGNLGDFDPERDSVELTEDDKYSIDAWALDEARKMIISVLRAYDEYDFRRVNDILYTFCNTTMSAVYLAAVKDRLYCERMDSRKRRRTQTAMYTIADALIRLLAPIIVHTAEDAYMCLHKKSIDSATDSVHLLPFPEPPRVSVGEEWEIVMGIRDRVLKALEVAKEEKGILNPLDAGIEVVLVEKEYVSRLSPYRDDMVDLCGVSRLEIKGGRKGKIVVKDLRGEPRCERSWKRDGTVKLRSDGGMLSDRDAMVIGVS
jgi:isoleucyl-tRNA synthetase